MGGLIFGGLRNIYIAQSTDMCFTFPQLISVAWYYLDIGMATKYTCTQAIVSDKRLWENICHSHIQRAYSDMGQECSTTRVVGFVL